MTFPVVRGKDHDEHTEHSRAKGAVLSTGMVELDVALDGGLHPSQLALLYAPPGLGKTTLAQQICDHQCASGNSVLYTSLEMSLAQMQASFTKLSLAHLPRFSHDPRIHQIFRELRKWRPAVWILDSLSRVVGVDGRRTFAFHASVLASIKALAEELDLAILMIAHVNKGNQFAGYNSVPHDVDVELSMTGRGLLVEIEVKKTRNVVPESSVVPMEKTPSGLQPIRLGYNSPLERRGRGTAHIGAASYVVEQNGRFVVDEIACVGSGLGRGALLIDGRSHKQAAFLQDLVIGGIPKESPLCVARPMLNVRPGNESDLAILIATTSLVYGLGVPADMAFVATIDNSGRLVAVDNEADRIAAARCRGYSQVVVPEDHRRRPTFGVLSFRSLDELGWMLWPDHIMALRIMEIMRDRDEASK